MNVYAQRNKPGGFLSKRGIGFLVTAALHVLIVYGLITGLARSVVEVIKGPIETKIIEEEIKQEDKPPPPPPKFDKPPPPFVPPPEVSFASEAPPAATAITQATTARPAAAPAPSTATVLPKANPRRPNAQPEYPPSSKRAGEAGSVTLLLYVDEEGKVADVKIDQTSGFPKLDEAAEKEARRSWRFIAGTVGGKPQAMWHRVKVTFKITD